MVESVDDFLHAKEGSVVCEGKEERRGGEREDAYHTYTPYSSDRGSPWGSWNASIGW